MLPPMKCDEGCGDCCGPVPCTETEFQNVRRYAEEHGVTPVDQGWLNCPFYQGGKCAVYPVRPIICKVFGYSEKLQCSRGYNVHGYDREVARMVLATGQPSRWLHELLSGWTPDKIAEANASIASLKQIALDHIEGPVLVPVSTLIMLGPKALRAVETPSGVEPDRAVLQTAPTTESWRR